jgi:signal transduction histidine kinase
VPPEVLTDESLLGHILTNLLVNAAKYSSGKNAARLTLKTEGDHLVFEIHDEGVGIPVEDQERLFKPFQRGRNVGKVAGTGLGLVIVKRCVELHGGEITIQSAEGAGATVRVRLPLKLATLLAATG